MYCTNCFFIDSVVRLLSYVNMCECHVCFTINLLTYCALTLLVGRQKGHPAHKKLSNEVLAWLAVWIEVHTCILPSQCRCHSLSLVPVKSRLVLPICYRLTRVVQDKAPLNVCVYVCVCCSHCRFQPYECIIICFVE